ncbi:fungal-specific transcription factor domain-containing protein [Trichophaea hybrida]|nr:fungal-specific transcription factor domain-containing protein [Trichophaea hybrida]
MSSTEATTTTVTTTAEATTATTPPPVAGQKRSNPSTSGNNQGPNFRAVKRRASKACQCCRARKVRCNVVEHGAPCTNCRLDEVECIVTESKRRKKNWGTKLDTVNSNNSINSHSTDAVDHAHHHDNSASPTAMSLDGHSDKETSGHVPHLIYQTQRLRRASLASSHGSVPSLTNSLATNSSSSSFLHGLSSGVPSFELPAFIKPTPPRIPVEDVEYLWRKGALTLPDEPLRSILLKAHFDFVHPYMPLLDRKNFLSIVNTEDGSKGKVGLLLFQAVMFSGSSFVPMEHLRAAGYSSRKAARKAFFIKTRLLYDFDHEQDRMLLVQALLLMSYWYETPDDQKDTWHWMGVAISLSHTIGLHRNPENSNMDSKRQKLWKRIWWSCYMRDRLVALGMRRPTRIKTEDCDVPMLTMEDFEIDIGFDENEAFYWSADRRANEEKDVERQKQLAVLCIEKAKLCVCISHVLSAQYSVLNTNQGSLTADGSTRTTMMLLPKKLEPGCEEVRKCDEELEKWNSELPLEATYGTPCATGADPVLILHKALLHLIYNTTVSALHRPQVLPSTPSCPPIKKTELQEVSRKKVRQAASEITRFADDLIEFDLVRYLPTTGVTVILPAVIIHLLDIRSSNLVTREMSLEGFALCMQVLQRLRQTYSAADYATHFLEAAIKKAGIPTESLRKHASRRRARYHQQHLQPQQEQIPSFSCEFRGIGGAISIPATAPPSNAALTPPPDMEAIDVVSGPSSATVLDESDLQLKLENFLQAPPSPHYDKESLMPIPQQSTKSLFSGMDSSVPDFSMPDADDVCNLDAFLGGSGDCDPFLGHEGMPGMFTMQNGNDGGMSKEFEVESIWSGNGFGDMNKILDGVDLSFDDVIQVLETEIN